MKKHVTRLIIFILILMTSFQVYAEPNYNFDAIKDADSETQKKINSQIDDMNKLDGKLSDLITKINKDKDTITKLTDDIDKTNKDIDATEKDLQKKKTLCGKRTRAMYMAYCNNDMLTVLFDAKSFKNFIERAEVLSKIMSMDKKLINDVKTAQDKLNKQSAQLNKDKKSLEEVTAKNQKDQDDIIKQKDQIMASLAGLKVIRAQEIENGQVQYLTDKLKKDYLTYVFPDLRLPKDEITRKNNMDFYSSTDLNTSINVKNDDIIMYSASLLGVTYLWGGNDAKGLDCSGFTKYVYKHFGIVIPRVAEDQQKVGVDVKKQEDLQPGDLLFFGQPAYHVAMYLTKGFMIEAPYTGENIKISPIRPYTNAKRYINLTKDQIKANTHVYPKSQKQPNVLDDDVKELPPPQ